MYDTTDRKRGPKGNKVNQTRTVGTYGYGDNNFCTLSCQNDWSKEYMDRAVDYIGRLREPKHLTEENAWVKDYDYNWRSETNQHSNWRFVNKITKEQRPITEQQYDDDNYTLNT